MKAKQIVLYASIALNVALLVLMAWPRHEAFGQYGVTVGNFAAASTKESDTQQSTWIADRVTGGLVVYDYDTGGKGVVVAATRNLRADLEENQVGNLMLVPATVSDTRGLMYVIDTDAQRLVIYEYSRSNGGMANVQKVDLRTDLRKSQPAAAEGGAGQ